MTIIYFIRHAKPLKVKSLNYSDTVQLQNEKTILSVDGEERAKILSELQEFDNVEIVISSNYVRAVATAKYIADKNKLDIFIDEGFRERKQGIKSWDELPNDFEFKQFMDENYKIGDGESQIEVRERMYKALVDVLEHYKDKKVVIVSHATAMIFLFKKWCEISLDGTIKKMIFNNKVIFEREFDTPEVFKLTFDDKNLLFIENIRPMELE